MDITQEIAEIGKLIESAALIMAVRKEVAKCSGTRFVVTDGRHREGAGDYEVVVECESSQKEVSRRIRSAMPDVDVDRIAKGVIGIRTARRGSHNG